METECPKSGEWFICEMKLNHQMRNKQDCIQKLIYEQEIDETCKSTLISLYKEALLELDDQHYAVTFPKPTKVQLNCQQEKHVTLQGSYIVNIPQHCFLKTSEFTIVNINNKLRGQPLKIISMPIQMRRDENIPTLKLNSISLNTLNSIEKQLSLEKPIEINKIHTTGIYHTTIPLYVLILFGASALSVLYYRQHRRYSYIQNNESNNIELSPNERKKATFSLNICK